MTEKQKIEERKKYVNAFNTTQLRIWADRMMSFRNPIYDTGALYRSLLATKHVVNADASEIELGQRFLTYGLWQNYGTGRETPRGNPGDIGRAKVREKRPWFDRPYYRSMYNIREFMADSFAQQYIALMSDAFSDRKMRQNATL